jgi:hypothetical protein
VSGFVSVEWIGLMFVVVAVLGVLIANGESIGGAIQGAIEDAIGAVSRGA